MFFWLRFLLALLVAGIVQTCVIYRLDNRQLWYGKTAAGDGSEAPEPYFRENIVDVVIATAFTALTMQRYFGAFFEGIGFITAIALAISALVSIRKPGMRHHLKLQASCWLTAGLLVTACHTEQFLYARHEGLKLLAQVQQFQHTHGHLPLSDAEIRQIKAAPDIDWNVADYTFNKRNGPIVIYSGTWIYWTYHYYAFDEQRWEFYMML